MYDSRVAAPFFGPNVWTAQVQPVAGGGIPPAASAVELRFVFKDGGAFDFHNMFERVKERIGQAREAGMATQNVDLEDLPTYEDAGGPPPDIDGRSQRPAATAPAEPPPGYEEVQRESVAALVESGEKS